MWNPGGPIHTPAGFQAASYAAAKPTAAGKHKGADRRPRCNIGRQHPYNKHAQKVPSNGHNKAGDGKKHVQQSSIQRLNVQHPNPAGKQKHANDVHRKSDQAQKDPSGNLLRVPVGRKEMDLV